MTAALPYVLGPSTLVELGVLRVDFLLEMCGPPVGSDVETFELQVGFHAERYGPPVDSHAEPFELQVGFREVWFFGLQVEWCSVRTELQQAESLALLHHRSSYYPRKSQVHQS